MRPARRNTNVVETEYCACFIGLRPGQGLPGEKQPTEGKKWQSRNSSQKVAPTTQRIQHSTGVVSERGIKPIAGRRSGVRTAEACSGLCRRSRSSPPRRADREVG